jgi:Tfp pilus assembly protein PilN
MAPLLPQVNLLPPEVKAARGLVRVKRWLALVVLLAVAAAGGLVFKGILDETAAEDELAEAQDDTARLVREQETYAEVPVVLDALSRATSAREIGMSTEILWRQYLQAVAATAPEGVRIENLKSVSATPMALPAAPTDTLSAAGISMITFTAQSATIPDTEAWLRALATVPGFSDAWFSQAVLSETGETPMYNVAAAVIVTSDGYAQRFSAETLAALEAEEDAAAEEGED